MFLRLQVCGIFRAWMFFWSQRLGFLALHVIGARVRYVDPQLSAERADVRHQLPDLVLGNLTAERRHTIRAAFDDCVVNLAWLCAVNPIGIDQRGPDPPATIGMAAGAVVSAKEALAFGNGISVLFVRVGKFRSGRG